MTIKKSNTTKDVYEDPVVVREYLRAYGKNFHEELAASFVSSLPGKKIIDVGCGPGHYSYYFSRLGYDTTGVDYSTEMIKKAKGSNAGSIMPTFLVVDMRSLNKIFSESSFDGVWANASILHISEKDIRQVIDGIHYITKNGAKVFISLKKDTQGERIIQENRYGKLIKRKFTFWERDKFENLLKKTQFKIDRIEEIREGVTGSKPTIWLRFFLTVIK